MIKLDRDIVKMIILSKFDEDWAKTVASGSVHKVFSMIWPTDLAFDLTWPIFEHVQNIVKMIILSKSDDDWTENVASRVFTRQKLIHDALRTTDR